MKRNTCGLRGKTAILAAAGAWALAASIAAATPLDDIGVNQLRAVDPTLTGTGVSVAQVEATTYSNPNDPTGMAPYDPQYDANNFEIDPAIFTASPMPVITYVGKQGTSPTTVYDPTLRSAHATTVATNFVGTTTGAAPGVPAVVNYNANYFVNNVIATNANIQSPLAPANAPAVKVVNQSFVFDGLSAADTAAVNQAYDDYVATHGTIIVSGVGNGGGPQSPATAYNSIAVGAYGGASSVGPTSDGRSKPDITAPESATSFSTPYVSGIAAVMVQAGNLGRGAPGTETASVDPRTVKALLLNGAVKPADWAHTPTQPLDPRYGSGIVNAYNSYQNLVAGGKAASAITAVGLNTPYAAPAGGSPVGPAGWNLGSLTSTASTDAAAHYLFNFSTPGDTYSLTSTLTWDRAAGVSGINNLDLFLYNEDTGTLANLTTAQSISAVDNVEQLDISGLAPGHYDLEVLKHGGMAGTANVASNDETYALAFTTSVTQGTPEPSGIMTLGFVAAGMLLRRRAAKVRAGRAVV
jgi:hypothetical protein